MTEQPIKSYFIIWFTEGEEENYAIIQAHNIVEAKDKAEEMFSENIISVQIYSP